MLDDLQDDLIKNIPPQSPDEPEELDEALTYPVPEDKRIGVSTDFGTSPKATDVGDEEVERGQTGIPD